MIHKFTLCCNKGYLFRTGKHFLIFDRWLLPPAGTSVLILAHGIMSENEYQQFIRQRLIPVYQSVSHSWIGLYPAHESRKFEGSQLAGYLKRETNTEWGGYLNVY